jgi:peptidoglycan/LPS O-acetylase OafA/YrhL
MAQRPEQSTIVSIQVLRGIAATAVVLHHSVRAFTIYHYGAAPVLFAPAVFSQLGSIGVDVFFVISGFIMSYISAPYAEARQPPSDFLIRRLLRIYPMYLFATVVTLAFLAAPAIRHGGALPANFSGSRLVTSLAFIPSFDQGGEVQPIVGVGWTLSYEMYFYLALTLAFYASRRWAMPLAAAALTTVWAAASLAHGGGAVGVFLRNPIIFEFIFGLGVAHLYKRGLLPKRGALVMLAIAVLALALWWRAPSDALRVFVWGAPAVLIVIAMLVLEREGAATRRSRVGLLFGDASYSVYLIHMIVIYSLLLPLFQRTGLIRLPSDLLIGVLIAAAVALAILVHLWLERPAGRYLRSTYQWLRQPRAAPASPPA